jgi:Dolichyl-phosphate-mannose-protein mannosyltransferase
MAAMRAGAPLLDPFPEYLSGNPYYYPLIASNLDAWGGLEAARTLSLVAILGVTVCVYWVGKELFGRESAILGAAIFAFQGSVLFLGRLATYDASCLLLLALSVVIALRSSFARNPLVALGIGPLLVLAVLNKYAALLWAPSVFAILAWSSLQRGGWRHMAVRVGVAVGSMLVTALLILAAFDTSFLVGMRGSTLSRSIVQEVARLNLAWDVVKLGGVGLGLAFIGCLVVAREQRVLAVILIGSALLAPAYHIYKAEPISLHKHIAYGLYFAAPLAGYALARLATVSGRSCGQNIGGGSNWLSGLALCLVVFLVGARQALWENHTWSDSSGMVTVMRGLVRPEAGHYLAEDMEVARYYLQDVTADWQWAGPFFFAYTNTAGQHFSGVPAYKAALADGYFDVVELSYGVAAPLDIAIQEELTRGSAYDLVAKTPAQNVYGSGYYWIWSKHVASVTSSPARMAQNIGARPPAPTDDCMHGAIVNRPAWPAASTRESCATGP